MKMKYPPSKYQNKTTVKKTLRQGFQFLFFLLLMLLTYYTVFSRNNTEDILSAVKTMQRLPLFLSVCCALFFVCAEGFMIWYLLRLTQKNVRLLRCFGYSFIGFFFSGITPSATGGQPAQLIAMKKDGIALGDATLTLMTVALLYKLVLAVIGTGLLLFWGNGLTAYLGNYISLYGLGLFLNILLVVLLLLVMFHGTWMEKLFFSVEKAAVRLGLCKPSEKRKASFRRLTADYQDAFRFFLSHKSKILFVAFCTFLQRCSLFVLTYLIYRGMGLTGCHALTVILLQASVYIAVDMLPLPGAQGISELMYHTVFAPVFTGGTLAASMCVTRGIGFYLPLIAGAVVTLSVFAKRKKTHGSLPLPQ